MFEKLYPEPDKEWRGYAKRFRKAMDLTEYARISNLGFHFFLEANIHNEDEFMRMNERFVHFWSLKCFLVDLEEATFLNLKKFKFSGVRALGINLKPMAPIFHHFPYSQIQHLKVKYDQKTSDLDIIS